MASRRITSVLFGDLVGFTSLSETRDQEDVRELLSSYFEECRQVIARYGGTVEKFIGDAVMAVWGVPTTHEDDAERAVRAGLELVNAIAALGADVGVPDLAMRVGIVTGEVAVTIGAEQQGMVAGDAVNTAARVQSAATPGQVWVDETTRLLTSAGVTYVDVGSHAMKGKADPVPLWSVRAIVAGMGGSQRADGLEAPHVGRDRELRLVKEIFHGVEETGRPTLLVVSGDAGVGKSRLAWEFDKYSDGLSTDCMWHQGRCLSYGEGVAFYALAEAFRVRLQRLAPDREVAEENPDQGRLLEEGLPHLVANAAERDWLQPRLGALLGVSGVGTYKREDLFSAWRTFLQHVSEEAPVVLLIDDAQHADDGLLDFVEHVLAAGTFPCFVMLLARPELLEQRPTLATNRRAHVLHLEPLPRDRMSTLLDGLVAGLPDTTRDALVARAEGIPLYAVETVRSLIDRDLVVPRGGQYVLADGVPIDLDALSAPASLQALIAARLDTLAPELRRLVDQASVLGTSFTREAIAGLCPDVQDLDAALAELVRVQLLRQESSRFSTEVGQYRFVQSGVRQVAYGTLSRRDRKASHLAVVRQLEQEDNPVEELAAIIAQHYLEAIDAVPDGSDREELTSHAVHHLRTAAARASALGAPAEAAGHLQAALARVSDRNERASIELELARQLRMAGEYEQAMVHGESARDAFDELGDDLSAASAVAVVARSMATHTRDYEQASRMTEERLTALRGRPEATGVLIELLNPLIGARLDTGRDFRDLCDEQLALAEMTGDESEITDAYVSLSLHYGRAVSMSLSRTLLEAAGSIAERNHDVRNRTFALVNLNASWSCEDLDKAVHFGRGAVSTSQLLGDQVWTSIADINLLLALILRGDWSEAAEFLSSDRRTAIDSEYWDLAEAYVTLVQGRAWKRPTSSSDDAPDEANARQAMAQLATVVGDAFSGMTAAAARAVEAVSLLHEVTGLYDDFTWVYAIASDVALRLDDRDAIRQLDAIVDGHQSRTQPRGVRAIRSHHRGLAAIWSGAEPAEVERHLRSALSDGEAWGSRLLQARVAADLASWLHGQGRKTEAVEPLQLARTHYDGMGATTWLADLEQRTADVLQ